MGNIFNKINNGTKYGIVAGVDSEHTENGYIKKINSINVAYLLNNQLFYINIPNERSYMGCFPIYPGLITQFCDRRLQPIKLKNKLETPYIILVRKNKYGYYPKEVNRLIEAYISKNDGIDIDLLSLDITEEQKLKILQKKNNRKSN